MILYKIEKECFETEGMGTQVSLGFAKKLRGKSAQNFPILGKDTTEDDLKQAMWVMQRKNASKPQATTWLDLQMHLDGNDKHNVNVMNKT